MKELKAVEILTNYIKNLNEMVVSLEEAPTVRILEYEAEQALAELKELTQEKSCEGCEHSKDMAAHFTVAICTCDDDDMPFEDGTISLKVGKKFYCKHYTPKSKE